ncbi:MAG: hypothetical protein OSJ58_22350 [Dysosmobacter sp.]|nr:hypothetical protein [Dysosmobacter sp.]
MCGIICDAISTRSSKRGITDDATMVNTLKTIDPQRPAKKKPLNDSPQPCLVG